MFLKFHSSAKPSACILFLFHFKVTLRLIFNEISFKLGLALLAWIFQVSKTNS